MSYIVKVICVLILEIFNVCIFPLELINYQEKILPVFCPEGKKSGCCSFGLMCEEG